MNKRNLFKATGIVMLITIISKILGLLRDATIASVFGATLNSDIYTMSMSIPDIFFGIIATAVSTTFIPILSESYKNNCKEDMCKFFNSIMNILFLVSILIYILGLIFSHEIVHIIAPKFTGIKYELTVELTRISMLNVLFMSTTSGYVAFLQVMNDFIAPALTGVVVSIPIIVYNILNIKHEIHGLMMITILGVGLQVLLQIPWLLKNGYKYSFKINIHDSRIKRMIRLIMPVIIGIGVNQINFLVDRMMASGLPDGSIIAMDFATKINNLVYAIFALTIVTVMYPTLSVEGISNDYTFFKLCISKAINSISIFMIPSAIGVMILRVTIIRILLEHGVFDKNAVNMTSNALLYLSIGMIFYGIREICNTAFYALKDTKTPMINGALGVGTCICMNLIMVPIMGLTGLAIANTSSAIVCTILLIKDLRRKIEGINGKEIINSIYKIILSSIVMGVIVYGINKYLEPFSGDLKGQLISLICSISIGFGVYISMLAILKVKEYIIFVESIKSKINTLVDIE